MNFELSDEHRAFQKMAADFARDKLAPFADQWDDESYFPVEVLREAAQLGLAGLVAKPDIGGAGLSRFDAALVFEQLAVGCVSTSAYLTIHNMVTGLIDQYGSEWIRNTFGQRLTSMNLMASYCLTEPNSGSDAASLRTTAKREGDYFVLNGSKSFISGATRSDVYLCMVRTGDQTHKGISCILVENNTPGLTFGKLEKKMGWKCQPTAMVYFENCRVPVSNLVGREGEGFKMALHALNGGRINIAACSLGGALYCLRATQAYLHERRQFGKTLSAFQALRFDFSEMLTQFEAARLLVYRAANAFDIGDRHAPMYCAMAKRYATEVAFKISDKAMQLHGGYGYLRAYQIERIFRDLRVHRILEGTNEIMSEILAKSTLDQEYIIE